MTQLSVTKSNLSIYICLMLAGSHNGLGFRTEGRSWLLIKLDWGSFLQPVAFSEATRQVHYYIGSICLPLACLGCLPTLVTNMKPKLKLPCSLTDYSVLSLSANVFEIILTPSPHNEPLWLLPWISVLLYSQSQNWKYF
jgi:hypothetical protein